LPNETPFTHLPAPLPASKPLIRLGTPQSIHLENRCTGNRTGGSNPSPSASIDLIRRDFQFLRLSVPLPFRSIWGTIRGFSLRNSVAALPPEPTFVYAGIRTKAIVASSGTRTVIWRGTPC